MDVADFQRAYYGLHPPPTPPAEGPHELVVLPSIWFPFGLNYPWVDAAEIDDLVFGPRSVANWVWRWSQGRVRVAPPRPAPRVFGPYLSWHAGPFYFRPKERNPQWEADFRTDMGNAGLDVAMVTALTPFAFPRSGSRYHGLKDGKEVIVDDRFRSGTSTAAWQESVEHPANEIDLTSFAGGAAEFDPWRFLVLMVRTAASLGGVNRDIAARHHPTTQPYYVYPPGEYRRDGQRGSGVRLGGIAELSYRATAGFDACLAVATEELIHGLGLLDAYPDGRLRSATDLRRPSGIELSDAGRKPVGLDPYVRLKFGWGRPVLAQTTGTFRLRPAEATGDMLILASPWRGQDEFFIIENRTAPPGGYDATRGAGYGNGLAIWHIIEDPEIKKDYARRAVSLLRPTDSLADSPLWDPSEPTRSYRLDDVSAPQHLRLLGQQFDRNRPGGADDDRPEPSGLAIVGMRWAGTNIDVNVRVPVRDERVAVTGKVTRLRAHAIDMGWGSPGSDDYMTHPSVVVMDTAPALRLGIASHQRRWGRAMFEQLLDAHLDDRPITVVYRTTGPTTGDVIRVE